MDERGQSYDVDTDDAAYALMELEGGIVATLSSSWATRPRRDDMLTIHTDGTPGSAVAGLHDCRTQALGRPDAAGGCEGGATCRTRLSEQRRITID